MFENPYPGGGQPNGQGGGYPYPQAQPQYQQPQYQVPQQQAPAGYQPPVQPQSPWGQPQQQTPQYPQQPAAPPYGQQAPQFGQPAATQQLQAPPQGIDFARVVQQAVQQPAAPVAPPGQASGTVVIPQDQYQQLQQFQQQAEDQRRLAEFQEHLKKGNFTDLYEKLRSSEKQALDQAKADYERKLADHQAQSAQRDASYRQTVLASELGRALLGVEFASPKSGEHAAHWLASQFEVRDQNGQYAVFHKGSGLPIQQAMPQILGSDDFAFYLKAQARPGSGASYQAPFINAQPQSFFDETVQRMQQRDPLANGSGLRPIGR